MFQLWYNPKNFPNSGITQDDEFFPQSSVNGKHWPAGIGCILFTMNTVYMHSCV